MVFCGDSRKQCVGEFLFGNESKLVVVGSAEATSNVGAGHKPHCGSCSHSASALGWHLNEKPEETNRGIQEPYFEKRPCKGYPLATN